MGEGRMGHMLSCEVDGCGVTKGVAKGGQLLSWPAKGAICTGARPNRAAHCQFGCGCPFWVR